MRKKIEFLIIGAMKAGTTTVYDQLARHPRVFVPQTKENDYFIREEFYRRGERYLDLFYRDAPLEQLWGGANVHLLFFSEAVPRIHAYHPAMKLIAVLRNPVERAYSGYWFARERGWESAATFEEALAREPEQLRGDYPARTKRTYRAHGHYAEQLRPYLATFGREAVRVVLTEELAAEPARVMSEITAWLGLGADVSSMDFAARSNEAGRARVQWFSRLLVAERWKARVRRIAPARLRLAVRRRVLLPLVARNTAPFRYPPMRPETRAELVRYYQPRNEALGVLLDRDFSHWT